jgi:hypothetical protein
MSFIYAVPWYFNDKDTSLDVLHFAFYVDNTYTEKCGLQSSDLNTWQVAVL